MAFYFICLPSKMGKCRSRIRRLQLQQPRHTLTKTFRILLRIGIFFLTFSLLLLAYLYFSELSTKTKLIDLALGSRSVEDMVKPNNDTLVLNGLLRKVSPSLINKEKNPFVLIAVTSLPSNIYRRSIIRSTWGKDAYEDYGACVVFFMGKPSSEEEMANLIKESEQFGDLIIDDFEESYYALSIKTLRLFKYFKFHHPKSKFFIKTDDDVFVNVQNLVHYCYVQNHEFEKKNREALEMETSDENNDLEDQHFSPSQKRFYFVGGVVHSDRGAHKWNAFSKWFAPQNIWKDVFDAVKKLKNGVAPEGNKGSVISGSASVMNDFHENSYPPYAEGNFYVLSDDAVTDILEVSFKLPLYHLEDVYVTGVLATWMLEIKKDDMPLISSASNIFPKLSYIWYKTFVAAPEELIAFHCDNSVDLISVIYNDSYLKTR